MDASDTTYGLVNYSKFITPVPPILVKKIQRIVANLGAFFLLDESPRCSVPLRSRRENRFATNVGRVESVAVLAGFGRSVDGREEIGRTSSRCRGAVLVRVRVCGCATE